MSAPVAAGVRLPFAQLPPHVVSAVEGICGGRVTVARDLTGGFSPGCATLITTPAGPFFVKAVGASINPDSPFIHRQEIVVLDALADAAIRTPRLIGSFDDGDWVAIVTEAIPGAPPTLPWTPRDVDHLLRVVEDLHERGTPCPAPLVRIIESKETDVNGWATLAAGSSPHLDAWSRERLDILVALELRWTEAADGDTLLHIDIRADNVLVTDEGARLIDWAWASIGSPLLELVLLAPALAMQGGPAPAALLSRTTVGRAADPDALRVLVAAWTGELIVHSLQPPPPGLPTVRAFQRAQATESLRWLKTLLP